MINCVNVIQLDFVFGQIFTFLYTNKNKQHQIFDLQHRIHFVFTFHKLKKYALVPRLCPMHAHSWPKTDWQCWASGEAASAQVTMEDMVVDMEDMEAMVGMEGATDIKC